MSEDILESMATGNEKRVHVHNSKKKQKKKKQQKNKMKSKKRTKSKKTIKNVSVEN